MVHSAWVMTLIVQIVFWLVSTLAGLCARQRARSSIFMVPSHYFLSDLIGHIRPQGPSRVLVESTSRVGTSGRGNFYYLFLKKIGPAAGFYFVGF